MALAAPSTAAPTDPDRRPATLGAASPSASAPASSSASLPSSPSDGGRLVDLAALVDATTSFVGRFDADRHPVPDVREAMRGFSRLANLAQAGKALCATRLASSGALGEGRGCPPAAELAELAGSSLKEGQRLLALGDASLDSSDFEDALRSGDLSPERADLVAKGMAASPGDAGDLLNSARKEPLSRLRDRQRQAEARGRAEADARRRAERVYQARRVRTWLDGDGAFRLDALLTPEDGARVLQSLTAEADAVFARARAEGLHLSPGATRADALVALLERGSHATPAAPVATTGDGRSSAPSPSGRAGSPSTPDTPSTTGTPDAPDTPSVTVPGGPAGCGGGPRAQITLRVDLAALRRGELASGEVCEIGGVGPVCLATARSLLGDSLLDLVVTNGIDVTTVAHLGRTVPRALRRALAERDGCCVVCGSAWNLEIDHWRTPFAEGGLASLDNLVTLCRACHARRHYGGYVLSGGPGQWRFEPGEGTTEETTPEAEDEARGERAGTRGPPSRGDRPSGPDPGPGAGHPAQTAGASGDQATLFGDRQ